jgi:uncharacterized protein (DUF2236 family)
VVDDRSPARGPLGAFATTASEPAAAPVAGLPASAAPPRTPAITRLDPGLFGPSSEAWRLDREAYLLLGAGPRALLLQIAHPAVAAGVADHSDFRADPWRRLDATLRSYLRIIYGTTRAARSEIRRLNVLHESVVGPGYSARDADLALWVHATLVDSTLVTYDAWLEPLSRDRRARYYEETVAIGRAFGVPSALLPSDLDAFERYLDAHLGPDGPISPDAVARELALTILHPPLPGAFGGLSLPTGLYDWTLWPAIGLLPEPVRVGYGFRWGVRERLVSQWLVTGWRLWCPFIPTTIREMPQARAADRRMRDATGPSLVERARSPDADQ